MQHTPASLHSVTLSGIIAALYVVLCAISSSLGLAFGPLQFRLSEALCLLPALYPAAVPGVAIGCLLSNLLSPYGLLDMVFGTLATCLAALWTRRVRRFWFLPVPTVLCNALIVGAVITAQQVSLPLFWGTFVYNALTVGIGEVVVCCALGLPLIHVLPKVLRSPQ